LIGDGFPITDGHLLAIPRRHAPDYFELRPPERNAIQRLLDEGRGARSSVTVRSLDSTLGSTPAKPLARRSSTALPLLETSCGC
jgi:hypothetical protein